MDASRPHRRQIAGQRHSRGTRPASSWRSATSSTRRVVLLNPRRGPSSKGRLDATQPGPDPHGRPSGQVGASRRRTGLHRRPAHRLRDAPVRTSDAVRHAPPRPRGGPHGSATTVGCRRSRDDCRARSERADGGDAGDRGSAGRGVAQARPSGSPGMGTRPRAIGGTVPAGWVHGHRHLRRPGAGQGASGRRVPAAGGTSTRSAHAPAIPDLAVTTKPKAILLALVDSQPRRSPAASVLRVEDARLLDEAAGIRTSGCGKRSTDTTRIGGRDTAPERRR